MHEQHQYITDLYAVQGSMIDFLAYIFLDEDGTRRAVGRIIYPGGTIQYFKPEEAPPGDASSEQRPDDEYHRALEHLSTAIADFYGYEVLCLKFNDAMTPPDLLNRLRQAAPDHRGTLH